jgi:hypothetical protein
MSVDVLALPLNSINTKWKEPYASSSLNAKLVGIVAPGIYRGLKIVRDTSSGDRTVIIEADKNRIDHVAVHEKSGFSITYRDVTSGNFTLSLSAYSNAVVVVCIYIKYQIGVPTTGTYRVFTESEFSGLSTSASEGLVVLGTVTVPISGAISAANISTLRRTVASANISAGLILNSPLVVNSDFELGEANASHARSSLFWDKSVTAGTGLWKTNTAVVDSGMKSIELNILTGPFSGSLSEQIGIQVTEGQSLSGVVAIRQLKTVASGSILFFMEWADVNDNLLSTTTKTIDGGVIDTLFRTVNISVQVPAGATSLRAVGIKAILVTPSSLGVFGYIDEISVDIEPLDNQHPYPFDGTFRRVMTSTAISLFDKQGSFSSQAAAIRFDASLPASEGRVVVEANNQSNLPPAIGFLGRLYKLGAGLLATESSALKPRVDADVSSLGSCEYTLMWESAREGESFGSYTQPVVRMYASAVGSWLFVTNASWSSTTWVKDVAGQEAFKIELKRNQFVVAYQIAATATWADAGWLESLSSINSAINLRLGTLANKFSFTPTALINSANIIPAVSNSYDVGSSASQVAKLWTRNISIGPDPVGELTKSLSIKSEWGSEYGPTQTEQVNFEYVSKHFGIWSRIGHRFATDWDTGLAVPPGWTTTSSGSATSTVLQAIDHRVIVSHSNTTSGVHQLHTIPSVKFKLTDGIVCRTRFKHLMGNSGSSPRIGFRDVAGNVNALTFGPTVFGNSIPSTNYGFLVGATNIPVGNTNNASSADMAWMTFAIVGSRFFWSYDLTNPDDDLDLISPTPTYGSASIIVPVGFFNFSILADGNGLNSGSAVEVDFVEIITGGRAL